jgi:DNA polymerase III sliding clamp (beta) subunit (PCNA family)
VLGCILFEAKGRELIIRATNLDLGVEILIPVKVMTEGKIAVPGGIVNSFLSTINSGKNVTLETVEGNLKVTTETNTTIIKSIPLMIFQPFQYLQVIKNYISCKRIYKRNKSSLV